MVSTGCGHSLLPPPSPSLPPPMAAATTTTQWWMTVLYCRHLWLAPVRTCARDVGEYLCDVTHSFGPALPEHHAGSRTEVLGVLYEAEETCGLVTSP